jgi:hypothetical protein
MSHLLCGEEDTLESRYWEFIAPLSFDLLRKGASFSSPG